MTMKPLVVDLSHHNDVEDWEKVYASGIRGVIHKASQGTGMVDKMYARRRDAARKAGLLWGAYHFADDQDVAAQVENFLKCAAPDDNTLLALDWEPNGNHTMSAAQAREFLRLAYEKTGQLPVLYSGNLAKEKLGKSKDAFLGQHRLWHAQYGPKAVIQPSWKSYWLWQYSGDGIGPEPHEVPGISTRGIDLNVFDGDASRLTSEWVHRLEQDVPVPIVVDKPAPPPPPVGEATAKDLRPFSRKFFLLVWIRRLAAFLGIGTGGTLTLADVTQKSKGLSDVVTSLVSDPVLLAVVCGSVAVIVAVGALEALGVLDYNEGQWTPSGAR